MQKKPHLKHLVFPFLGTVVAAGFVLAQSYSPAGGSAPSSTPSSQPGQANQRVVYQAQLVPGNPGFAAANANVTIVVDGDQAGIFIQGSGFSPNNVQMQHIHSGSGCPTIANDLNGDGIVDAVEGTAAAGPPIFPLTLDIAQTAQSGSPPNVETGGSYPMSSADGSFYYIASVPVAALESAISSQPIPMPSGTASPTSSPTSSPSSSAAGVGSSILEGLVIEVHGVGSDIQLPNTVEALPGSTASASLPVACGVISRVAG
jgi:hypothetical protein